MSGFENFYEKLYGNPPIAEFIINTKRLFEILTPEGVDNPLLTTIKGVLVFDGQLVTFVNCNTLKLMSAPVSEGKGVVAFASKMFNQVFRLPKNKDVKVIIKKDVIEFKIPEDETYSLVDVLGYVILK